MPEPLRIRTIYDTRDNVIHFPASFGYRYDLDTDLEGLDQFIEYLNRKAGSNRFTRVDATPLVRNVARR